MFLVRDWAYSYEHDFGANGGKSYVDECLLESETNCDEGNSVRQNLRSAIERIDGFLLPHPGLNVEQIDFSGTNEGLAEFDEVTYSCSTLLNLIGIKSKHSRRIQVSSALNTSGEHKYIYI